MVWIISKRQAIVDLEMVLIWCNFHDVIHLMAMLSHILHADMKFATTVMMFAITYSFSPFSCNCVCIEGSCGLMKYHKCILELMNIVLDDPVQEGSSL